MNLLQLQKSDNDSVVFSMNFVYLVISDCGDWLAVDRMQRR